MGGETRVLAWEDASLVGYKLLEKVGVFKIESIHSKIDFRLRAGSADFSEGAATAGAAFL